MRRPPPSESPSWEVGALVSRKSPPAPAHWLLMESPRSLAQSTPCPLLLLHERSRAEMLRCLPAHEAWGQEPQPLVSGSHPAVMGGASLKRILCLSATSPCHSETSLLFTVRPDATLALGDGELIRPCCLSIDKSASAVLFL